MKKTTLILLTAVCTGLTASAQGISIRVPGFSMELGGYPMVPAAPIGYFEVWGPPPPPPVMRWAPGCRYHCGPHAGPWCPPPPCPRPCHPCRHGPEERCRGGHRR